MIRPAIRQFAAAIVLLAFATPGTAAAQDTGECVASQLRSDPESVIAACSRLIADGAKPAAERGRALSVRGSGYYYTKRWTLAAQDYDAAIALLPTDEELLLSRSSTALRLGDGTLGRSLIEKVLTLNPSNPDAMWRVGAGYEDAGDYRTAIRFYAMALTIAPRNQYALLFSSTSNQGLRRFDEALKTADALVGLGPDEINLKPYFDYQGNRLDFYFIALKNRARIHWMLGHVDRAEQDLNAAVTYRRSAMSLTARGHLLTYTPGREQQAFADLQEAKSLGSEQYETFFDLGLILAKRQQFREALAEFDRAAGIFPPSGEAVRMRALMHRELGETDLAFDDMIQAVTTEESALKKTVVALRTAGYWRSSEAPDQLTPDFKDAIRACMLDKLCK
ncbi:MULTISPECIES: tetratricopeptide repeat protein [Bradyrhizobium]|jgi:tetratricopeptide (TPR) repeat protein|uniref:tetratricopeptide repeat protein n=1 Tax=Bradyrhizobium TaxID=374 RepID=UPI0003A1F8FC|nr:tetratricopeptide repeat protein [Bradyrhizobium denitrificans]MCL8486557.1 tetratricopeptide repeat protein [Bradyrhizobium denitrificans]